LQAKRADGKWGTNARISEKRGKVGLWKIINSPIFLLAASTLIIGGISQCYIILKEDHDKELAESLAYNELMIELANRVLLVRDVSQRAEFRIALGNKIYEHFYSNRSTKIRPSYPYRNDAEKAIDSDHNCWRSEEFILKDPIYLSAVKIVEGRTTVASAYSLSEEFLNRRLNRTYKIKTNIKLNDVASGRSPYQATAPKFSNTSLAEILIEFDGLMGDEASQETLPQYIDVDDQSKKINYKYPPESDVASVSALKLSDDMDDCELFEAGQSLWSYADLRDKKLICINNKEECRPVHKKNRGIIDKLVSYIDMVEI
jgi:hypothetical protein